MPTSAREQRKAMLHILVDYEQDRRGLVQQAERLDNSRRALLHILQDSHRANAASGGESQSDDPHHG